jgi:hypothetical protein
MMSYISLALSVALLGAGGLGMAGAHFNTNFNQDLIQESVVEYDSNSSVNATTAAKAEINNSGSFNTDVDALGVEHNSSLEGRADVNVGAVIDLR